jgi:hypothetical protein
VVYLPRNPIGWPETNRNSAAEKPADQTCVFGKKSGRGFQRRWVRVRGPITSKSYWLAWNQ